MSPERAPLFAFDFDGTVAPIVDDPDAARPHVAMERALDALRHCGRVALLSGRPLRFLMRWFPDPSVDLAGSYGLETRIGGVPRVHEAALAWAEAVDFAAGEARRRVEALNGDLSCVEVKDAGVALHWRRAPGTEAALSAIGADIASATGLVVVPARSAVEIRPPVLDKGEALEALVGTSGAALFAGDDHADVPAFERLHAIGARRSIPVIAIAVASGDAPAEVAAAADLVVDGPSELAARLPSLAAAPGRAPWRVGVGDRAGG